MYEHEYIQIPRILTLKKYIETNEICIWKLATEHDIQTGHKLEKQKKNNNDYDKQTNLWWELSNEQKNECLCLPKKTC